MIELNLLPEELKKKKKRIELPEIPLIPITIALVGALVIVQLLLSSLIFLSKKQLTVLDKTWQALAPKKAEFDDIKKKISTVGKKAEAIEDLIQKRLNWSVLLNELSNSLTANIWLTELGYDERIEKHAKLRILTLSGCASGRGEEATTYIARFIKALKDNKNFFENFDDIELGSIKKSSVAEQDVMKFNLICRFKPQETGE